MELDEVKRIIQDFFKKTPSQSLDLAFLLQKEFLA